MADGRILSKRISRSSKVAALSSDTSRMFYSWLIPYLDVEGRLEADTKLLKADIAPLLDHITAETIQNILNELNSIGLIQLYEIDNIQYLQLVKFDELQKNLRKDRETPSKIPKAPAELRQNSGEAPTKLPHKINISLREDKANLSKLEAINYQTVDNSKPLASFKKEKENDPPKDEFLSNLKSLIEKTKEKYPERREQQAILLFVQSNIRNKNPAAITHCINSLIRAPDKVTAIQQWLEAALKIEDGKYNAADSEKRCNEFKTMPVLPQNVQEFSNMIQGIFKPMPEAH